MTVQDMQELASEPYLGGRYGWVGFALLMVILSVAGLVGVAVATTFAPEPYTLVVWALVTAGVFGLSILLLIAASESRKR